MVEGANGKLYGFSSYGGLHDEGVFVEFDPLTNQKRALISFDVATTGIYVQGVPLETSNGVFVGLSSMGIFEYNVNLNQFTLKISSSTFSGGIWSMMKASNGKIYGTQRKSNTSYNGDIIFEYDPQTNVKTTKYSFPTSRVNGFDAAYSMVETSPGVLYGTTRWSNSTGGVVYSYNYLTNTFTKRQQLSKWISSGSIQHSNGKLYFYTLSGGVNNNGRFYEYSPSSNSLSVKHDVDTVGNSYPIELSTTKFLFAKSDNQGITPGYFYEYNISNALTTTLDTIGSDFNFRINNLLRHSNGKIYGTGDNYIFEYDVVNSNLMLKTKLGDYYHGRRPTGKLLQASDGSVYGVTNAVFNLDVAFLYKIDPNTLKFEIVYEFQVYNKAYVNGYRLPPAPYGHLLEVGNRYVYGIAEVHGVPEDDIMFRYDLQNDTMEYIAKFYDTSTGSNPDGELALTSSNTVIGTCRNGGANGEGTIFEYNISGNNLTKKLDFTVANKTPSSGLIHFAGQNYWGLSEAGYSYNAGNLFNYDFSSNTVSTISRLRSNSSNSRYGLKAIGNVLVTQSNKYYGVSKHGGSTANKGIIFEVDTSAYSVSKKVTFTNSGVLPHTPETGLIQTPNGRIFGVGNRGGINYLGGIFEFNPVNNTISSKFDFTDSLGKYPEHPLTLVGACRSSLKPQLVLSADTVCSAVSITITVTNPSALRNDVYWGLYADSLSTVSLDSSASGIFNYTPTKTTVLYVRGEGGCQLDGESDSIIVVYDSSYNKTINTTSTLCQGENFVRPVGDTLFNVQSTFTDTSILQTAKSGCDSIVYTIVNVNSINTTVSRSGITLTVAEPNATYQWNNCRTNSPVPFQVNQTFNVSNNGIYNVIVSKNNCVDTSTCQFFVTRSPNSTGQTHNPNGNNTTFSQQAKIASSQSLVGLNALQLSSSIYPNPAKGIVSLSVSATFETLEVKVLDIKGRLVQSLNFKNNEVLSFSLKGESGIYFIQLTNEKGERANLKVVKQ